MRVLFDTCVLVDILQNRQPFATAANTALKRAITRGDQVLLSAKSLADLHYLMRKTLGAHEARAALQKLLRFLKLVDTAAADFLQALQLPHGDLEDQALAHTALRLGASYIITRNTKDFADSPVQAITPEEYLTLTEENS